jgi:amidophosphoribosyltransferase
MLNLLADNLQKTGKFRIDEDDIFRAVGELMRHCHGAYACTGMLAGFGIIAFRDPNGIRPIGYGRRRSANGKDWDYAVASESVVCDALGFTEWTDVQPGEVLVITKNSVQKRQVVPKRTFAPDLFEYVYFARPDSVMDGISIYSSRMAMGEALAKTIQKRLQEADLQVDVVIPVPDTSRVAALQAAQAMNVPYREGFCKNRYVGRTFIMPGQSMRRKNVRRKLNAMTHEFAGKNVLLVDGKLRSP